jgi:hypothetical protein
MELPRQPLPVSIAVDGDEQVDIEYWLRELRRYVEGRGHNTGKDMDGPNAFKIYPRAVNE